MVRSTSPLPLACPAVLRFKFVKVLSVATLLGVFIGGAEAREKSAQWCVEPSPNDVACKKAGSVSFSTTPRRKVRLQPESTVRIESGGLAQVAFKRQALCQFGPAPTEIVTRYSSESHLFLQREGYASCSLHRKAQTKVPFFCDGNLQCPAVVTTSGGSFSLRMGSIYATQSALAVGERRAEMILCSSSYVIRVAREGSYVASAGSTNSLSRIRVTLVENESSVDLTTETIGTCADRPRRGPRDIVDL